MGAINERNFAHLFKLTLPSVDNLIRAKTLLSLREPRGEEGGQKRNADKKERVNALLFHFSPIEMIKNGGNNYERIQNINSKMEGKKINESMGASF